MAAKTKQEKLESLNYSIKVFEHSLNTAIRESKMPDPHRQEVVTTEAIEWGKKYLSRLRKKRDKLIME